MKKRQILCAIVFGSMLAITGCGGSDDGDSGDGGSNGSAGSDGSGGAPGGGFCDTLCEACGGLGDDTCRDACQDDGDLDGCPVELAALISCLETNGCEAGFANCAQAWTEWGLCVATMQ